MLTGIFEQARPQRRAHSSIKSESIWIYQLKKLLPILLIIYSLTLFILLIVVIIHFQTKIHIYDLTHYPPEVMGTPIYTGLLSNIGILFWSFSAAICLFCASVLQKDTNRREFQSFLLVGGIITTILLLDDLFLLHTSISSKAVYAGYGVMILMYLIRFRKTILSTDFLLLLFAFGFFVLSAIIDMGFITLPAGRYLFEDGAKLFGIISWFAYFTRIGIRQVKLAILFRQQGFDFD